MINTHPDQDLSALTALLDLQIRLTNELLALCRRIQLSTAYTADAVNSLYSLIDQLK